MHNHPDGHSWELSQRFSKWLRWTDGTNVLLADKSEAGWFFMNERDTRSEYTPEHVHHNYLYTDEYEKSRVRRGKEGAAHGQYLPDGKFHSEEKW